MNREFLFRGQTRRYGEKIITDTLAKGIMQRVNNPAIRNWLFAIINETPAADVQEVNYGRKKTDALLVKDDFRCPCCGTYNETIKKRKNTVAHDVCYCWHCGQALKF